MTPEKTGGFIATLRKEHNLTQKDLAELLGVTPKAVSRWETGRGYPDVELLPHIAKVLDVTVAELLSGEKEPRIKKDTRIENTPTIQEQKLTYVCYVAAENKRRSNKKIIWLSVGLGCAAFIALAGLVFIMLSVFDILNSVDKTCIISPDYSYIIYEDERYVPLDSEGYSLCEGEMLVEEAYVKGSSVLGKLLFGDSVYSVSGNHCDSIIYLDTDYDFPPSDFYVKESELEKLEEIRDNFSSERLYMMDIPYYRFSQEELVDVSGYTEADVWEHIFALPQKAESVDIDLVEVTYYKSVSVVSTDENRIFYQAEGEIVRVNEDYYWLDCEGKSFDENYNSGAFQAYHIDSIYYEEIENVFLRVNGNG